MKIQRDSAVPLYQQLANLLRHQIETGILKPGAAVPPESTLTRNYQVSRITARLALECLVSEGLIIRKQGKGSYVCPPKIQQNLEPLQGFAELMAERRSDQAMQVIEFDVVSATDPVAKALGISLGTRVLRIKRCHLLKKSPIAYAVIYLPYSLGRLFELSQIQTTPIYALLTQKANVQIKRATQVVRAIGADPDTATILKLPRGAPVMMIERTTFSEEEIPVEYILLFYRGDSYELAAELHRDPAKNILQQANALGRFASDS